MRKVIMSLGLGLLLFSGGCMSGFNERQMALRTDAEVCSRYGADTRSAVYLDCMALREEQRDAATARQNRLTVEATDIISGQTR